MSKATKSSTVDAIMAQYQANKPKEKTETKKIDRDVLLKKYFNPYLQPNQKTGEFIFRILPVEDGGSPFVEVHFHQIKVNNKWEKIYCPKNNDGDDCPICNAEDALKSTGSKEDKELSRNYRSSKFYIVRGIDRDKPEDGVKFWRFKHNYKQQGIFDKIIPIFGKRGDITDVVNGCDLTITVGRDDKGNSVVTSIIPELPGKLSDDKNDINEWTSDETTWKDVFRSKGEEYLQAVVEGRAPYWDDSQKKYVTPGKTSNTQRSQTRTNKKVEEEEVFGAGEDDDMPF